MIMVTKLLRKPASAVRHIFVDRCCFSLSLARATSTSSSNEQVDLWVCTSRISRISRQRALSNRKPTKETSTYQRSQLRISNLVARGFLRNFFLECVLRKSAQVTLIARVLEQCVRGITDNTQIDAASEPERRSAGHASASLPRALALEHGPRAWAAVLNLPFISPFICKTVY